MMLQLKEKPLTAIRKPLTHCCKPVDLMRKDRAEATVISIVSFSAQCLTDKTVENAQEVEPMVRQCPHVWIDVEGLSDKESVYELLKIVDVSEAIQRNIFQVHQKPFCQQIKHELLLVVPILRLNGQLELQQLSVYQNGNTVITFHEHPIPTVQQVKEDVRNQHSLLEKDGRLYLLQRFVESSIDCFQPILEQYSRELECIEDDILAEAQLNAMQEIHRTRKELLILKRIMLPLHNTLRQYARDSEYYSGEGDKRVARELLQHGTHMFDMVEYYLNVTSELMSLHMSTVSNKMNQCMTLLAIVAAIFLPPSLVASIYGMNFYEHNSPWNMPELAWDLGYPFALFLMVAISVLFLIYFWKNGWLRVFYANQQGRDR
ncbi:MAG: magnesium/cobalt transporter CorA [Candidatus Obscuribacterales bacterium]|nr:magnesium/cobalt transporter CorA [Candidatus Obscuribacterales bacterium]